MRLRELKALAQGYPKAQNSNWSLSASAQQFPGPCPAFPTLCLSLYFPTTAFAERGGGFGHKSGRRTIFYRSMRFREGKWLTQGHTESKWQSRAPVAPPLNLEMWEGADAIPTTAKPLLLVPENLLIESVHQGIYTRPQAAENSDEQIIYKGSFSYLLLYNKC